MEISGLKAVVLRALAPHFISGCLQGKRESHRKPINHPSSLDDASTSYSPCMAVEWCPPGRRKRPHHLPSTAPVPTWAGTQEGRFIGGGRDKSAPTLLMYVFLLIGENTAHIALILHAICKHNHCSEDNI